MIYVDVDPVAEVRQTREQLLEKYGGIEGYCEHLDEERPKLEAQGWKFITVEAVRAKKTAEAIA